ncbi:MAG: ABC transporter permease subunit [Romboutsia sp.]|uniref:ABC transporter permease subunit n=1 Tax=Romboutsia sp. TaxID=1965302 RepID=UPI003F2EC7F3
MEKAKIRGLEKSRLKSSLLKNIVPITFLILAVAGIMLSDVSLGFMANELYRRIIRNTIMILALIVPIMAGMGINFSIVIGALCAHFSSIIVVSADIKGLSAFFIVVVMSMVLALICGNLIGFILNKSKGREMITSLVIGLLGTSIYNIVFMVGYGTIIKPKNDSMLLSNGIGVQSMVDLARFKEIIRMYPFIPILFIVLVTLFIIYITNSKLGVKLKAIGESMTTANSLGIEVDKCRRYAIVISTIIASMGQLMFIFDIGALNVYTGHLNVDVFACASLLAGGATLAKANLKNVFVGVVLFHSLFIVSPLAGQNLFSNAALGEYFRSFIAYSTIIFSLIMNMKNDKIE